MRTPSAPGEVDPGLDGDHVAGLQVVLGALGETGRLVNLHPDAVPQPVTEALAVTAGSITPLATPSMSRPVPPARTASRPASWAALTSA